MSDSSPGSGSGDEPFGGPAFGGQRPTGSHTGLDSDSPASSADDVGASSEPGADSSSHRATDLHRAGSAAESADRFPPKAGREVESEPQPEPEAGREADSDPGQADDPQAALERERDEYRDALVRLQADFENYKKRILKQQTEHLERAAEALVDKLLPVLDTADLALAHGGGEEVKQVTAALTAALEREGLERIDPVGSPFDPTLHDAVAHEPSDGGEQVVVEVMRAGYRWKGRVLRPALVKVRG